MCKKLICLISFVLLLCVASSVQAFTEVTTAEGNGADTFLSNDGQGDTTGPNSVHGTEDGLTARRFEGTRMKFVYIRFDISEVVGDLNDATLSLNFTSSKVTRAWNVYGLYEETDEDWDEPNTSYNNAPGVIPNPPTALGFYAIDEVNDFGSLGTISTPASPGITTSDTNNLHLDYLIPYDTNKLLTLALIPAVNEEDDKNWYLTAKEGNPALAPTLTFPHALKPPASYPDPEVGELLYSPTATLDWQPGAYAAYHDIYLSEIWEDVNSAKNTDDMGSDKVYKARQSVDANSYSPIGLEPGKTYYWRIDEVNEAGPAPNLWRDEIWSFSIVSNNAYDPIPTDTFMHVAPKMTLRWSPGYGIFISPEDSVGQNVYLSDNFNAVNNAPEGSEDPPFKAFLPGRTDPNWNPSQSGVTLEYNTTYYWRVDGVDEFDWPFVYYKGPVWSFTTVNSPLVEDPNLIMWWKFDGDVSDSGGYEIDGTAYGNPAPNYVDGVTFGLSPFYADNNAIYLLGTTGDAQNQYVEFPINSVVSTLTDSTFAIWANFMYSGGGQKWHRIFDFGTDPANYMFLAPRRSSSPPTHFEITTGGVTQRVSWGPYSDAGTSILPNEWHHLAVTIDADNDTFKLYVDGTEVGETTDANLTPSALGYTTQNWLGRAQAWNGTTNPALFMGYLDDFRIYNRKLEQSDILKIITPPQATRPNPANNEPEAPWMPVLSWWAGSHADTHKVYFSGDFNDVNERTALIDTVTDPYIAIADYVGPLHLNTTYYWAVDEVNTTDSNEWAGDVWNFTVAGYVTVDDMEQYGDNIGGAPWKFGDRIYYVWRDGWDISETLPGNDTGSQVYHWNGEGDYLMETTIARNRQSMPFYYENDGETLAKPSGQWNDDNPLLCYSEASALTAGENSLPGIENNWTVENVKSLSLWFYGDPNNDIEQMYVALEDGDHPDNPAIVEYDGDMDDITEPYWHEWNIELTKFTNMTPSNVQRFYIGFGNRDNPQSGGAGIVYFDDIRLYPDRCILSERSTDFTKADYAPAGDAVGDCTIDNQELEMMVSNWLGAAEQIRLEAEDADMANPDAWEVRSDKANTSGGEYIVVAPDYDAPNEPNLSNLATYDFTVNGGTYKILGRVNAPSGTEDSFWCSIPGATTNTTNDPCNPGWIRWDVSETAGDNWVWDELNSDDDGDTTVQFTLSAGAHTLKIGYRERTSLDRLWITDDLGLTEAGLMAWSADLSGDDRIDFDDFAMLAEYWLEEQLWP